MDSSRVVVLQLSDCDWPAVGPTGFALRRKARV